MTRETQKPRDCAPLLFLENKVIFIGPYTSSTFLENKKLSKIFEKNQVWAKKIKKWNVDISLFGPFYCVNKGNTSNRIGDHGKEKIERNCNISLQTPHPLGPLSGPKRDRVIFGPPLNRWKYTDPQWFMFIGSFLGPHRRF